ncbi:hypothetical protein [Lysobacter sp. A289]
MKLIGNISSARPLQAALAIALLGATLASQAQAQAEQYRQGECGTFTIAAIPDTQNYMDFSHQKSHGFPIDAAELYFEQMRYIADNARSNGGDIVFATHLGDIWQNRVERIDPGHAARGFKALPDSVTGGKPGLYPEEVPNHEIPTAVKGFEIIANALPFSVVPGNHDYDAVWTDPAHPPQAESDPMAPEIRHFGGLTGFLSAFSEQSNFFRDQPWYIASNDGGADSAQVFTAGECKFLHLGLQYDAPDSSLAWARRVINQNPGLPTIVTTHKYTGRDGRHAVGGTLDMSLIDRQDNNPQMVWDEFISQHDQIFLVLSGHIGGQGHGIDYNDNGHEVHQMLSDYQPRAHVAKTRDPENRYPDNTQTGDGWLRLLTFNLDSPQPSVHVRTYSTHYGKFSSEIPEYAAWYKAGERQADTPDAEFMERDDFVVELTGFHERFDNARP